MFPLLLELCRRAFRVRVYPPGEIHEENQVKSIDRRGVCRFSHVQYPLSEKLLCSDAPVSESRNVAVELSHALAMRAYWFACPRHGHQGNANEETGQEADNYSLL